MIEGEVATSVDDLHQAVSASDVTATPSRDVDECDDVTDDDDDAFLAGFRDCRRQAVHYLRQRDMDISDELERHLAAVERTWRRRAEGLCDGASSRPDDDDVAADLAVSALRLPHEDGNDSALGVSLVDDDDVTTHDVDDEQGQSAMMSELSDNACDLLRLAQNNPRINNILSELFTLMDDDDDDCVMTCDCDDVKQNSHDTVTSRDAVSDVSCGGHVIK